MSGLNNLNFQNFITFKGSIAKAEKADETKAPKTGATLPPALECDTFVKSKVTEPENHAEPDFDDDYDEEFKTEEQIWLQERLEQLDEAAQNLENQSLEELYYTLNSRFNLEFAAPDIEPSFKTIADVIISKLDKESINTKEAADILYLAFFDASSRSQKTREELSGILPHVAALLHEAGKERYQAHFDTLEEAFKDTGAKFSGRVKTPDSIQGKIPHAIVSNIKKSGEDIFNAASDICGYRLVVDGTEEQTEKIIHKLEELLDSGEYTPFLISSHGENPYVSKDKIMELCEKRNFRCKIMECSGFVGTNIILKDKEGKKLEIQITGKETNKVNVKEHRFYKLWSASFEEQEKYFKSRQSIDAYEAYANECYTYARNLELGIEGKKPELPEGIDEELRLI